MEDNKIRFALDKKGRKIVVINEILFYGKRSLPWEDVKEYLKKYIGKIVTVDDTGDLIFIGSDFPDEFKGSQDTKKTHGAYAKAKANAAQGVEELIKISRKTSETPNYKQKNSKKAKYGWYRYLTRFALPVLDENDVIKYYNIYLATLVVRKAEDKKLYLYDIVNVKKEDSIKFEL